MKITIENYGESIAKNGKKFLYINNQQFSVWDESIIKQIKDGAKEIEVEIIENGKFKNLAPPSTKKSKSNSIDTSKIEEILTSINKSIVEGFQLLIESISKIQIHAVKETKDKTK